MGKVVKFKPKGKGRRHLSGAELIAKRQENKPKPPRNGIEYLNELQRRVNKAREEKGK